MKVRNRKYPWTKSRRERIRVLLNATPEDGCLLLFNADHRLIRKTASECMPGYLSVHNVGKVIPREESNTGITDLYVCWKGLELIKIELHTPTQTITRYPANGQTPAEAVLKLMEEYPDWQFIEVDKIPALSEIH